MVLYLGRALVTLSGRTVKNEAGSNRGTEFGRTPRTTPDTVWNNGSSASLFPPTGSRNLTFMRNQDRE